MSESMLAYAIVGHLWADFILQNDWQALNKKKHSFPCFVHCVLWVVSVVAFTGWFNWYVAAWLFGTHFIIDRTPIVRWWMTVNRQEQFATGPLSPWSIVVVDQVWHLVTLFCADWFVRQYQ